MEIIWGSSWLRLHENNMAGQVYFQKSYDVKVGGYLISACDLQMC